MSKKVLVEAEELETKSEKQKVSIKGALALTDGFYKGEIIKAGRIFDFEGLTRVDGSLPLWIESKDFKPKKSVKVEEKGIISKAISAVEHALEGKNDKNGVDNLV